ncbi:MULTISPECIES: enoyl-CoA hydratase/isomerase family protein [Micrococcaceae]|jgi:enoyl-CoA hydratase/carnithine racemase|uniref:enoyl-CoA hydratase/isomerase family protein n=1 Tax=Micrococcaceae TaxID=1268 RepID=UPI000CE3B3AA|nr:MULTISPECIES: enoyl-CoA hydratase-related protein [Micrococcaceae]MDF2049917.1 enoyl-CoA hydratase-related protein [Arthrobacter sp. Cr_A7]MDT0168408.1 enoyl-CoA hydratase-related protein [Pseudarthrobacter sp. BRE9]BCW70751.1 crotonase [Arthrobacter sp. NicSoilB8]
MAWITFDDYKDKYQHIKLERDEDGILLVTFHTDGSDVVWGVGVHDNVSSLWDDISRDRGNRVVIITGAGDTFIDKEAPIENKNWVTPEIWLGLHHDAKRLVLGHLDIEVPMIAAVNGPARYHNEQALLCDIVIASEDAVFADHAHFSQGNIPGDGMQIIWPLVIGLNRGRYFHLTGQEITAQQAYEWGAVNEVVPKDQVVTRAYELARMLAAKPTLTLRSTRMLMVNELKKTMNDAVSHGMMTEGLVAMGEGWNPTPLTGPELAAGVKTPA